MTDIQLFHERTKQTYEAKKAEKNKCANEVNRKYTDTENKASEIRKFTDNPLKWIIAIYIILALIWMSSRPGGSNTDYGGPIGLILWPLILCGDIIMTAINLSASWFWGFILKVALFICGLIFFMKYINKKSRNSTDKAREDLSRAQSELQKVDVVLQSIVAQIGTLRGDFENKMRQLLV